LCTFPSTMLFTLFLLILILLLIILAVGLIGLVGFLAFVVFTETGKLMAELNTPPKRDFFGMKKK